MSMHTYMHTHMQQPQAYTHTHSNHFFQQNAEAGGEEGHFERHMIAGATIGVTAAGAAHTRLGACRSGAARHLS
jgi:hypothetical protein